MNYLPHLADPNAVINAAQAVADAGARLDAMLDSRPEKRLTAEVAAGAMARTLEDLRHAITLLELQRPSR